MPEGHVRLGRSLFFGALSPAYDCTIVHGPCGLGASGEPGLSMGLVTEFLLNEVHVSYNLFDSKVGSRDRSSNTSWLTK